MEIAHYVSIARRWAWLLILGLILGMAVGYGLAMLQTPIYQASTRVVVSRASMQSASGASSGSGNLYDFFLSDQILIQTYVELLKASSIFDHVSQILNYPVSPAQVQAEQVKDTRIISIIAEDPNPQHAAEIANAVVTALIAQNEELEAGRYKASDESLQIQIKQVEDQMAKYQTLSGVTVDEQIAEVKKQMEPLQAEVTQLQKDIAILSPPWSAERKSKITELQARLDQIQPLLTLYQEMYTNLTVFGNAGSSKSGSSNATTNAEKTLSLYQQIYLNLINTREAIRLARMQNTQSVNQIEPAAVPSVPVRPQPFNNAMLAGVIGLMLASGGVFLIEYLDDTLKSPEDVERALEVPTIGFIADIAQENDQVNEVIYVSTQPRSPVSEAFRSLRTNLEFAAVDKPLRTILVTSAEAGDGKSTVSANLAAIFAQGGKRVLLMDCDLRRPHVHRFTGLQNRVGLTDLFRDNLGVNDVISAWSGADAAITISVITSGILPPNPAELLGSKKMDHILAELISLVDVVVLDSPPSMVADAQVLAAKADCVLLVVQPGKTHAGAARATREQLIRAGANIIGSVLNRIPRTRGYYYGGYRYYSPYYYQNDKYLTGANLDSPFRQHTLESDETPFLQSFFKKALSWINRRQPVDEIEAEEIIQPQPLLEHTLNPAGWQIDKADEAEQMEAPSESLRRKAEEVKQIEEPSSALAEPSQPKKAPLQALLFKTEPSKQKKVASQSLPRKVGLSEQKKAELQTLLRKAAQKVTFDSATPSAKKIKLPPIMSAPLLPAIIRSSNLPIQFGNFTSANISSKNSLDTLVGTDYKFLIHKASAGENLERYAAKYKTTVESIAAVNYKMPAPAWIIPVGFKDVARLPSFTPYEVKGKIITIGMLARDLGVNPFDLKYYNGIHDARQILTNDWLLIPQTAPLDSDHILIPTSAQPEESHRLDTPIGTDYKFVIHKVLDDENLRHYASRYKTSMEAILTVTVKPPLWTGSMAVIPVGFTDVAHLPRFEVYATTETRAIEALAQELQVDPHKLKYYNGMGSGEKLAAGDWLLAPRSRASALWRSASLNSNVL